MARKATIPNAIRLELARQHGCVPGEPRKVRCAYCDYEGQALWFCHFGGEPSGWVHFSGLEMDHIVPESRGGATTVSNITLACRRCNRSKGTKTLEEWLS